MKHIVIIGGGFAGVAAGIQLKKYYKKIPASITLIDTNTYHVFTPSLYEVATSEEPQKNIAIPYREIFDDSFSFLKGRVEQIQTKSNEIILKSGDRIPYDYLLLAAGSEPSYHAIPGLQEHSVALKTLKDAVFIKNKIKTMCCKEGHCHKKVKMVIGGGGFAGTELAAEMLTYKDILAKQHGLSKQCLEITIIQGGNRLLNELDTHVSDIAKKRLSFPNVHFAFGGHIQEVTQTTIKTDNGNTYPYDILIWTGGVEANHLAASSGLPVSRNGQILVNQYLQVQGFSNIFSAGDIAGFLDPATQKPVPTVAQVAEEQGNVCGINLYHSCIKEKLLPYSYRHFGYVVPLRSHFAVAELLFGIHFDGFPGWVLQQFVFLRYLLGILPFYKALVKWNKFELDLTQ